MKKLSSVFALILCLSVLLLSACAPAAGDEKINLYTRDGASGTREGFESVIGFKGQLSDRANEVASNGEMAKQVGQDVLGIGYVSLTTDFAAMNLKPLQYEGVDAGVDSVNSGDYLLKRPFCYVTRAVGDYESQEKEDLVKAFVSYLTESKEGREVVLANGGIVDVEAGRAWDGMKQNYPIVDRDNSQIILVTGGSTSVEKTIAAALASFQALAGNFQIKMEQTGSGDAYKRVLGTDKDGASRADIGFASRDFKADAEPVDKAMASGTYCQDAIVAVVNIKNASIDNVTKDQLFRIFTGTVENWDEISK